MSCPACGKDVLDIDVKCGHCGAALGASGAHRLIGTVMLGQYELIDVLGQGGMSVVFKGRHKLTNQEVALKILPPELAAHSQVKSRFLDEAKALAALDHPNIVHLYNFGQDNGYFALAMQFVDGQTWERLILEAQRLDWVTSCRIAIDVLRALEYAHGRGVIHRDMKPSNVLVRSRDSIATVMDFGIAKMTTSTRLTATGQTMGTVRYMSPEQVRGQEVDLRTDIYSLGATLYESLVGDTPFTGNTHFEIMTKHLSDAPRRPSKQGAELPEAVEDAVMRCLSKRPDDRFATARDLRKQLEAALRASDIGLIETQKLDRAALVASRPAAAAATPGGPATASGGIDTAPLVARREVFAGPLADELEPGTTGDLEERCALDGRPGDRSGHRANGRRRAHRESDPAPDPGAPGTGAARARRRWLPWLAIGLAIVIGGGAAGAIAVRRASRFHATVEIAGVALTKGTTAGALRVETDGAIEPAELAALYTSTLDALRLYVKTARAGRAVAIADPIDVLLAVPRSALCEPSAYFDHQVPPRCDAERWAIAIGARGTHRLMVVSDRAQLIDAVRRGVARAVCEFSPAEDEFRELCDVTARFAESTN